MASRISGCTPALLSLAKLRVGMLEPCAIAIQFNRALQNHVGTAALGCPVEHSSTAPSLPTPQSASEQVSAAGPMYPAPCSDSPLAYAHVKTLQSRIPRRLHLNPHI